MGNERKVAVVTGGATGIGREIVLYLSQKGYDLGIIDDACGSGIEVLKGLDPGSRCIFVELDTSNIWKAPDAMEKINTKFGRLDVLINAIDILSCGDSTAVTEVEWDRVMETNLKEVFFLCQAAVPYLKIRGGCILNISSILARIAVKKHSIYSASKAGVVALTREMATDLGRYNIKCNALLLGTDEAGETLSGKPLSTADVCETVEFLISEGAFPINAFDFPLDGGMHVLSEKRKR